MVAGSFTWGTLCKCHFKMSLTCDYLILPCVQKHLMLWIGRIQNRDVVDYLCTDAYWQQKDYCVWQQKMEKKINQLAYTGSMYENWQWGLWKWIRAVRLFGLNFISGDTADVASKAQHPNRVLNNLPYRKQNFKNNRTIQNRYQLRQQTFYYSSNSLYSFWLMVGNFGDSFAQKMKHQQIIHKSTAFS